MIPTLNEAEQIADCVRQVSWADETIVADAGSTDRTVALARQAGAVVLEGTGPTIAAQRNAAARSTRASMLSERLSREGGVELGTAEPFSPDRLGRPQGTAIGGRGIHLEGDRPLELG